MIPIQKDYIIADEHKPGMNGRGNAARKLHHIFSTTPSVFAVRAGEAIRQVQDLVKKHVFATALVAHTIQFCYSTWKVCLWTIIEKWSHGVFMDGIMFDHPSRRQNLYPQIWKLMLPTMKIIMDGNWDCNKTTHLYPIISRLQKNHPKFKHPPHLNFMFGCFCQVPSPTKILQFSGAHSTSYDTATTTLQRNLPPFQEA